MSLINDETIQDAARPFIVFELNTQTQAFIDIGEGRELARILREVHRDFLDTPTGSLWLYRPMSRQKVDLTDANNQPVGQLRWAIGVRPPSAEPGHGMVWLNVNSPQEVLALVLAVASRLEEGRAEGDVRKQGVLLAQYGYTDVPAPVIQPSRAERLKLLGITEEDAAQFGLN